MSETSSVHVLVKMFQCQQYADEFREGKLFANTLKYFQGLEALGGQADPYEGSAFSDENSILTLWADSNCHTRITPDILEEPIRFQQINHVNVICFHELRLPFIITDEPPVNPVTITKEIRVPQRLQEEFGPHMVVIPDRAEFNNRLKQELYRQYIKGAITTFKGGKVQYEDYRPKSWEIWNTNTPDNRLLAAFYKRSLYEYQSEYRLAFERQSIVRSGSPHILNIGDIKDITFYGNTSAPLVVQARNPTP